MDSRNLKKRMRENYNQLCPLEVKSKTTETGAALFRVVVSLHPHGRNNFVLSRYSTAGLQHN